MRRRIVAICASQRAILCLTIASLMAFSGCSDGKIGRNKVNGVVNVDGKPAPGMMVIFCPIGGTPEFQKARPMGLTKEDGTFEVNTFGGADGAPAGQYKVLMNWPAKSKGPSRDGMGQMGFDRLQGRYNNLEKSPFTVEVKSGTNDLQPFELKSR
jgi:hypothetical protein